MMGGKRTPPTTTTVATRIVQARLQFAAQQGQQVTQAWLAKALGVSPGTVSQWEKGITKPEAYDTLPRIAIALGTSPAWLAWGDDGTVTITNPRSFPKPDALAGEGEGSSGTAGTPRHRRGQGGGGR